MKHNDIPPTASSAKERNEVRWYILLLPYGHRGPAKGLQEELDRRAKMKEPLFEFFAPSYKAMRCVNGKMVESEKALMYNYIFIRASEKEIYRMKNETLSLYNFLPRRQDARRSYYPYLTDREMDNLQWIARAYSHSIPICTIEPDQLIVGDRVRITSGQFAGAEASVVKPASGGAKSIMVSIDNWMWVPLIHVRPDEYEIISLNEKGKHQYSQLDNDRMWNGLHQAMGRMIRKEELTEADHKVAKDTLKLCKNLTMNSDVMRSKLYSLLMQAYCIEDMEEACHLVIGKAQTILPLLHAEQSKALLLISLYGCTDNILYREEAEGILLPWKKEGTPKKVKRQLLQRFYDFDSWLHPEWTHN